MEQRLYGHLFEVPEPGEVTRSTLGLSVLVVVRALGICEHITPYPKVGLRNVLCRGIEDQQGSVV